MFPFVGKPINAYEQVSIGTSVNEADPHQLILMLFEGASAALKTARFAMQEGNIPLKGGSISKAIDIIANGLGASLDENRGGDLALQLGALYEYMVSRLLWANLKNDLGALKEVETLLGEIHEAWRQIDPAQIQQPPES
ncbi:flagellar export chaperone FliS [Rhodocyclus tenuis]|uniref:flagellar export chaperone FliS n=1 Tax=Rhodocyclus tenuis TaxID=1066 RepID=UPI001906BA06|nr:flagellar export chaperone FliS [Rhodocyclus tenuis]MBK1679965.1 flagellar export chaperone FliS [Rhodocyclus tenuis]